MMYTSWEGKEEVGGEWEGGMGGEWEGGKKEGSGRKVGRKEGVEGRGKEGRKEGVGGEGKGTLWSREKRDSYFLIIYMYSISNLPWMAHTRCNRSQA